MVGNFSQGKGFRNKMAQNIGFLLLVGVFLSLQNGSVGQATPPSQIPGPTYVNTGISRGKYKMHHNTHPAGFVIRKEGFFRYAFVEPAKRPTPQVLGTPTTQNTTAPSHIHLLDVDSMHKYYHKLVGPPPDPPGPDNREFMDTDFQMLEWPGKTSFQQKKNVQKTLKKKNTYCSSSDSDDDHCKVWMLQFDRDNGKIQHYPCNAQEGTSIVALASIRVKKDEDTNTTQNATTATTTTPKPPPGTPPPDNSDDIESPQKIWLSHGTKSIYTRYIQPMFVPGIVLMQMGRTKDADNPGFCELPDLPVQSQQQGNQPEYSDFRTVHDFTFTRGRLLLGMKCGILIVTGLTKDHLSFEVATLRSENGTDKNFFKEPVNKISASVCCSLSDDCTADHGIVAAYSYKPERSLDDKKFIYVSFDRGTLFEKKLVASKYSPINLIVGLYKVYREWHHYYEFMNNPDTDDIMQDIALVKKLREKPIWKSSTTDGKEQMFGGGITLDERKRSSLQKVAEILHDQVPQRRQRLGGTVNEDLRPRWVQKIFNDSRQKYGWKSDWTDENCEYIPECNEKFVNDTGVEWLLHQANITVKTPKIPENDKNLSCIEITSILVIPEERLVLGICRVELPPGPKNKVPVPATKDEFGFFAFFKFPLHTHTPLTHSELVSQRVFYCRFIKKVEEAIPTIIQPELVRIPGSVAIFVINCDGIVYVTTNFGVTLFNAAFYFAKEVCDRYQIEKAKYDANDTTTAEKDEQEKIITAINKDGGSALCSDRPPPPPLDPNNFELHNYNYVRSFSFCALDVPPILTADRLGAVMVMTFGRFYARGAIAYSRETRFFVGESLGEINRYRRFENVVFPGLNTNGDAILALSMARAYSIPDTKFKTTLYKARSAIRLVPMPFQLYKDSRSYHSSNIAACSNALEKGLTFSPCQTISFSVQPKELAMDVGETKRVKVNVKDDNPYLPLWIFSSNGNSVEVNASLNQFRDNRSRADDLSSHHWDVKIKNKPNQKDIQEGEHLVDSFFGSDYGRYHDYSTQISLVNVPNIRCHVQPTATVDVEIGCKGKKLVAHEDSYRPQCEDFKDFKYTIKQGEFDPDLANYWILKERPKEEANRYVHLTSEGNLDITYNYAAWGCPLEPFVSDDFIPDLRTVPKDAAFTKGDKFKGKFILIEIFGATGYSYTKKLKDANLKDCKRKPNSLKDYIDAWKVRQRLFKLATERLEFPARGTNLATVDWLNDVRGNKILHNDAIKEHINIWNRANNMECNEYPDPSTDQPMTEKDLEEDYEIMQVENDDDDESDDENGDGIVDEAEEDNDDKLHWRSMVKRAEKEKEMEENVDAEYDLELGEEKDEDESSEDEDQKKQENKISWGVDRQRVYLFLAVAIDEYDSLCNYHTVFGVSLRSGALDISDLYTFLIFFIFVLIWIFLMITGYYVRRRFLRASYIKQARMKKLEQAAWTVVYRYEKMLHDQELKDLLYEEEDVSADEDDKEKAEKAHKTKSKSKKK